jgi:hypothetical protein
MLGKKILPHMNPMVSIMYHIMHTGQPTVNFWSKANLNKLDALHKSIEGVLHKELVFGDR